MELSFFIDGIDRVLTLLMSLLLLPHRKPGSSSTEGFCTCQSIKI